MNVAKEHVVGLVAMELQYAKENHEDFHSLHEGYAVMLEEIEECRDELQIIQSLNSDLWETVKDDDAIGAKANMDEIEAAAVRLASEAIQVAAMARKAKEVAVTMIEEG